MKSDLPEELQMPPELPPRPRNSSPVASLSRATGTKSRTTLTTPLDASVHPLLSSSPTSSTFPPASTSPQYHGLTYQTRKKAPPQTTSVSGLSSNVGHGQVEEGKNVQDRLRDQNLKAQLQDLGLSAGTTGWEMVFWLANGGGTQKEEREALDRVWDALKGGKVTLLLPTEPLPSSEHVSVSFLLDHCLLSKEELAVDVSSKGKAKEENVVTLSGLKGGITEKSLVLSSCGIGAQTVTGDAAASTSKVQDFSNSEYQRVLLGSSVPPLSAQYPSFGITSPKTHISIPRTRQSTPQLVKKPPAPSGFSRFFGRTASSVTIPASSDVNAATELKEKDEKESSNNDLKGGVVVVPVVVIDASVKRKKVVKSIGKGLDAKLRAELKDILGGLGGKGEKAAIDRVCHFAMRLHPTPALTKELSVDETTEHLKEVSKRESMGSISDSVTLPPAHTPGPHLCNAHIEDISTGMQDMFNSVRQDLEAIVIRKGIIRGEEGRLEAKKELATVGGGQAKTDEVVDQALEKIEDVLCFELYDRIFSPPPPISSDRGVDENLSSKIAALSILDLGLDHLGIDLENGRWAEDEFEAARVKNGLEEVARGCGFELSKLQASNCKTPSAKLEVLVNAHRVIVDGLSALPPIQLKDEKAETKSISSTRPANEEVEMDDAKSIGGTETKDAISDALPHIKLPEQTVPPTFSNEEPSPTGSPRNHSTDSLTRKPEKSNTSSADLILPLLIFAVVQGNPPMLVSNLLFIQRFHADHLMRGESAYCSVNLSAVADFLENVDTQVLGLATNKVISPGSTLSYSSAIRGKVTHELDNMVGSASKVLSGVVDTSYKMLFSPGAIGPRTLDDVKSVLQGGGNIAASTLRVPRSVLRRASTPGQAPENNLTAGLDVAHIRNRSRSEAPFGRVIPEEPMNTATAALASLFGQRKPDDEDKRSIRSVSSILSSGSNAPPEVKVAGDHTTQTQTDKLSIQDRLATLARERIHHSPSASVSKPSSLHNVFMPDNPTTTSPTQEKKDYGPPIERFMTCEAGDLRLEEIPTLLKDYKRLAEMLNSTNTFKP
ncbi:hypothetical protein BT69DRAFT_1346293 [Atractiella rhizophila]|nr:hypothetical protein BT69DRAFT_1346293 [Atractiella rhizophila]